MPGYGRTDSEWDELVSAGREFLLERAKLGKPTSYTELNVTLARRTDFRPFDFERHDERAAMGHLLGLIVERDQALEPSEPPLMLSALVSYLNANDAGPGFYQLAKELRLLSLSASKAERDTFWIRQVNGLYDRHRSRPSLA
ncbi:hypothetical protein [Streptomyces sp. NPDC020817]|uniref:hypothetical protein n=1 Tax=Streptomyces sp. NPDC020817 TaxID=3365095 RepID=UPI00379968AB